MSKFGRQKLSRLDGLVAHAKHPINTGKLEGFNNKIKVAKRTAYGDIARLQIALKECSETEYWIELLLESGYYSDRTILEKCVEVKKILISSINTSKSKNA